jgi:hypothetical protein
MEGYALPQSVDSKGHKVVHRVVRGCYIAEDAGDWKESIDQSHADWRGD